MSINLVSGWRLSIFFVAAYFVCHFSQQLSTDENRMEEAVEDALKLWKIVLEKAK